MTHFQDIEALVASRQKIHAIKEFRARTGVGLKEAKDAVEWFEAHGQWPTWYHRDSQAGTAAVAEPTPPPASGHALQAIEELVAQGQLIGAIKELRSLISWGLKETKDAVDEYRARGAWSAHVLATLGVSQAARPSPGSPAPGPQDPARASALQALAACLGHAPHVHLAVRARRAGRDGHLVMLRDRCCLVAHERGQWVVDPVIAYDAVHHVEVDHLRGVLYVSCGHVHERFELPAVDAEAALALFRVFAP
jgi:ribosomal protein L7/L12